MSPQTSKQIISSLSSLSAEDRAGIVRWCDALGVQNLTRQDNPYAEHVFEEFSTLLSLHYHTPPQSLTFFIRTRTTEYRRMLRAVDRAVIAVDAWWPGARRNVRLALLRYICRIVFDVCTKRSHRVGWAQLIPALLNVESSINDAFPGWLRQGMFQERALTRVTGGLGERHESDSEAGTEDRRQAGNRRGFFHDPG